MHSALYLGRLHHRRSRPVQHEFSYRLFMTYLDLDELSQLCQRSRLLSTRVLSLLRFRRRDYLGPANISLAEAARQLVYERSGVRLDGPVRLLTHLRTMGFVFNPVSFYYCYSEGGNSLRAVIAHITNTPWGERHAYVLNVPEGQGDAVAHDFGLSKEFHVSPFMPMEQQYRWRFGRPGRGLGVHMENHDEQGKIFDATLTLRRQELTDSALVSAVLRHPLLTLAVVRRIYWQAARLTLKRAPFHTHPDKLPGSEAELAGSSRSTNGTGAEP